MEQNNSQPVDDFSFNVFSVTPYQSNRHDTQVSDGDKAGATLLFSGIFLGLVGITFTVMGWIRREGFERFEWTQLLGPILLSVGVTFALISVCKFKMLSCKSCKNSEETALDTEQPSGAQSFVFTGINQPITFHGATVVQYIPPPYTTQDGFPMSATSVPPIPSVGNGTTSQLCPPQYYSIYPMDNPTFLEDDSSPNPQSTINGYERGPDAGGLPDDLHGTSMHRDPPPLYEEIFPERNDENRTTTHNLAQL
ncbi:transmembrane protein 174 [Spea bombifrons]|uniref:transmembrane protein 174 n=1 Tax=Spea bombifrons TaxID=233779 RepID=UPI00234B625D|nr:transmembrane protein 174 [Spea bombifrons]